MPLRATRAQEDQADEGAGRASQYVRRAPERKAAPKGASPLELWDLALNAERRPLSRSTGRVSRRSSLAGSYTDTRCAAACFSPGAPIWPRSTGAAAGVRPG